MAVSERDKQIMARLGAALKEFELPEDAELTGEARAKHIKSINERRRKIGMAPLVNDEDETPELGFHRAAVARGMVTRDKNST